MRVEEQDKIEEMESWERLKTQAVGNTLREVDDRWEKGKSYRKTTKEPLLGRSIKTDVREQGGTRKKKKLKYEMVEDGWGATKMIIEEPVTTMVHISC